MKTQYFIGGLLLVLIIVFGIFAAWKSNDSRNGSASNHTGTPTSATTTTYLSSTTAVVSGPSGSYTISVISEPPAAPAYKTPIMCASTLSQEECQDFKTKDATIIAMLNKTPTDFAAWIDLGILRKEMNDYAGAAQAWVYVTQLYPNSPIAYDDLGDLYMNFVKNYAKAESNWLKAIAVKPDDALPYENLFSLYTTTSYKSSSYTPESILKKGITNNPNSIDLQVLLARYYKSQGRTADAKAAYDAAIKIAQNSGNQAAAQQIQQEEASL